MLALALAASACSTSGEGGLSGHARIDGAADSSGITVTLAGTRAAVTTTAGDGSYYFAGDGSGSSVIVASAGDTREATLTVTVGEGQRSVPDLVFHAVGTISGRVTRGGAAAGNGGIVVLASGSSAATSTDDSGAFALTVAPGSYDLDAFTSGFLPGAAHGLVVGRGAAVMAPEIDLNAAVTTGPGAGNLAGIAALVGGGDPSGITVTLAGGSSTTTAGDGSFTLPNPPDGIYALSFDAGAYHETAPAVLAIPDASGFYVDGSLYPLSGSTLVLPRGRRQVSGAIVGAQPSGARDNVLFTRTDSASTATAAANNGLYTIPSAGGSSVLVASRVRSFVLAPDGQHVAYAVGPDGNNADDVYVAGVDGSAPAHLIGGIQSFSFTGDGSRLIVQDRAGETYRAVPVDGSPSLTLSTTSLKQLTPSPKGDAVMLLDGCSVGFGGDGPCDLRFIPFAGGAAVEVAANIYWFLMSPTFDRVIYGDATSMWIQPASGGTPVQLTTSNAWYAGFTPDGQNVLFLAPPSAGATPSTLSIEPAGGGTITSLAANVSKFTISPGGHLAYALGSDGRTIETVSIPDGAIETVSTTGYDGLVVQFSPSGRWAILRDNVVDATSSITLSVAPAESGVFHTVASGVLADFTYGRPNLALSADETQIAYVVDDGHFGTQGWVEAQPTAGGAPTRIADGASWVIDFSPRGTQLLWGVGSYPTTIVSAPAAGGTPSVLLELVGSNNYGNVLNPFFVDDATVFAARSGSPAPFGFQDGLYRLSAN